MLAAGVAPAWGQTAVQQVVVELSFDGATPHRIIRDRLEATVSSVAERLLLGRPLEQVAALQRRPEAAIASVMERVAVGFAHADAAARRRAATVLSSRLRPAR